MATVREPDPLQPQTPETEDARSQRERMHTVAGRLTSTQRRPRYGQPFYPVTIFGSAMYILATAVALIILSLIHPADSFATLGASNQAVGPADPINHVKYNPRPEWYFLFLFQLLKYFQGPWEIVGTAIIPGIATVILLGLPGFAHKVDHGRTVVGLIQTVRMTSHSSWFSGYRSENVRTHVL